MIRPLRPFLDRFWSYIQIARLANGAPDYEPCWPWTGAKSRSGRRKVCYGVIQQGPKGSRLWRAHRVALMLWERPLGDAGDVIVYLLRVNPDLEAAHQCDNSLCCNPTHLLWETHVENLARQRARQRIQALIDRAPDNPAPAPPDGGPSGPAGGLQAPPVAVRTPEASAPPVGPPTPPAAVPDAA